MVNQMVLSTEIEWIGYEAADQVLQVEFIAGAVYQYKGVPNGLYHEFLEASSYGSFFEKNIKNKYAYRRIV